ncbi:hypothetical protein MASR2M70_05290 [Bacillota bacterium]
MLDTVIVASEMIPEGTLITRDMLMPAGVLKESRIYGSMDWDRVEGVIGYVADRDIVQNGQLSGEYLADEDFLLGENESVFVLHKDWILMRSSSIRRGDRIDIYKSGNMEKIGDFRVAFVKDENEVEVTDGEGVNETKLLNRTVSTGSVSHVEIIAGVYDYEKILNCVSEDGAGLLLVQKGD